MLGFELPWCQMYGDMTLQMLKFLPVRWPLGEPMLTGYEFDWQPFLLV